MLSHITSFQLLGLITGFAFLLLGFFGKNFRLGAYRFDGKSTDDGDISLPEWVGATVFVFVGLLILYVSIGPLLYR